MGIYTWLAVYFKVEKNILQLRITSLIQTHFHLVAYMDLVCNIILPEIGLNRDPFEVPQRSVKINI